MCHLSLRRLSFLKIVLVEDEPAFDERKGPHSINTQAVYDHKGEY